MDEDFVEQAQREADALTVLIKQWLDDGDFAIEADTRKGRVRLSLIALDNA